MFHVDWQVNFSNKDGVHNHVSVALVISFTVALPFVICSISICV